MMGYVIATGFFLLCTPSSGGEQFLRCLENYLFAISLHLLLVDTCKPLFFQICFKEYYIICVQYMISFDAGDFSMYRLKR